MKKKHLKIWVFLTILYLLFLSPFILHNTSHETINVDTQPFALQTNAKYNSIDYKEEGFYEWDNLYSYIEENISLTLNFFEEVNITIHYESPFVIEKLKESYYHWINTTTIQIDISVTQEYDLFHWVFYLDVFYFSTQNITDLKILTRKDTIIPYIDEVMLKNTYEERFLFGIISISFVIYHPNYTDKLIPHNLMLLKVWFDGEKIGTEKDLKVTFDGKPYFDKELDTTRYFNLEYELRIRITNWDNRTNEYCFILSIYNEIDSTDNGSTKKLNFFKEPSIAIIMVLYAFSLLKISTHRKLKDNSYKRRG